MIKYIVFGGTGTIGTEIVKQLLQKEDTDVIRIFSNDENSLFESKQEFGEDKRLRWILGDVRDYKKVEMSCRNIDFAFNCAAIKHVDISEYNPIEVVNVNIIGLENIIQACFYHMVVRLLHISTDKAVEPTSVMGATKLIAERLCVIRNNTKGSKFMQIGCVRLGNVYGSRGSLVPIIKRQLELEQPITVTSPFAMRYFITIEKAGKFILDTMSKFKGGEIHIPKMENRSVRQVMMDVIGDCGFNPKHIGTKVIGLKKGEKVEEKLYLESECVVIHEDRIVIGEVIE